ncbi:MAG: PRC-barrel domain-containing protein [Henriciella sp.]|uniref:PRC-barrel domain-containing protein n=1 Tax=Henriciella sp. TaxID=1968823 RepID=UPI003C7685DD
MKRLLTATAIGALTVTGAMAQTAGTDEYVRVRDIIGGDIMTMNEADDEFEWEADTYYEEVGPEWNDIGEIEDVILDQSGMVVGIVAEVGGVLDLGDKHVFLPVADIRLVADGEDEFVYVTRFNEEDLEELEDIDETWWK